MALEGTGFRLKLLPVASLLPHEKTVPEHVSSLAEDLEREGIQKDPIIIDGKTRTVLDGMHRLAAFLKLGYANAVCCLVDYDSSAVSLRRWARCYIFKDHGALQAVSGTAGLSRTVRLSDGKALVDFDGSSLVAYSRSAAMAGEIETLDRTLERVEEVDKLAERLGWERRFLSEDDLEKAAESPQALLLLVRRLRKDEVVSMARSEKLFPCKTSMHVIDPRPVDVRFPVNMLDSPYGPALLEEIAQAPHKILNAGSTYEGRKYKERLLLLNPDD